MAGNTIGQGVTFADINATAPSPNKFVRGAMTLIEGKYDLSDIMPFINTGGQQSVKVPRPNPDAVGGVYYRNANGQYTWTRTSFENYTEDTAELTYAFKIDSQETEDPSYTVIKPAQGQMSALAEQFSAELIDSMFNGDPDNPVPLGTNAGDYARLAGVRYRLRTGLNGIDTTLYQSSKTFNGAGTTEIDLTTNDSTMNQNFVTAMNLYIATLKPNVIASNFLLVSRAMQLLRTTPGLLTITKDNYGRTLADWAGVRWIMPGLKHSVRQVWNFANTSDWVFPYETNVGVYNPTLTQGNRFGTIWFLRCNTTDGLTGFSVTGMKPRGPEKLNLPDEGVGYGMRYGHGWGTLSTHCIGAMFGVKYG